MKYRSFSFSGTNINYRLEGEGKTTLVLLHGFMNDLTVWDDFVLSYMNDFRVVVVDLLGHGESELKGSISTMELQASMVKALLDYLNIPQCVMCGHSMGGMITLTFADLYPQSLKGFCLLNSQATADSEKGRQNRKRAVELIDNDRLKYIVDFIPNLFEKQNRTTFASEIEDLKAIALKTPKESIIAAQNGMIQRQDRTKVLQKSYCPVLFISGKQDIRIDIDMLYAQAFLPRHSETMILNTGHMSFIEQSAIVKRRLSDFTKMCFDLDL